jgi:hypothetical protein
MWNDFSDFELAELAVSYNLHDYVNFGSDRRITNRVYLETLIEEHEYCLAFNSDLEYT